MIVRKKNNNNRKFQEKCLMLSMATLILAYQIFCCCLLTTVEAQEVDPQNTSVSQHQSCHSENSTEDQSSHQVNCECDKDLTLKNKDDIGSFELNRILFAYLEPLKVDELLTYSGQRYAGFSSHDAHPPGIPIYLSNSVLRI